MSRRTVILSDTHLGRPHAAVSDAAQLRPLWQGADRLIVNGDVAEVHHPRHWSAAACQVLKLYDLCEQDGVELVLLSGNHDPYLSDIRHIHLADGAVFVTHGDVLHPAIAPWSPAAGRMREAHDEAIARLDPPSRGTLEARLSAAQHASLAEWQNLRHEAEQSTIPNMLIRPWAIARVLAYWRKIPRLAADFLVQHAPAAQFIIIGHTHRPGVWPVGARTVINTGSFGFPGTPRAVVLQDTSMTIWRLIHHRDRYEFASDPHARFFIPPEIGAGGAIESSTVDPVPAQVPTEAAPAVSPEAAKSPVVVEDARSASPNGSPGSAGSSHHATSSGEDGEAGRTIGVK